MLNVCFYCGEFRRIYGPQSGLMREKHLSTGWRSNMWSVVWTHLIQGENILPTFLPAEIQRFNELWNGLCNNNELLLWKEHLLTFKLTFHCKFSQVPVRRFHSESLSNVFPVCCVTFEVLVVMLKSCMFVTNLCSQTGLVPVFFHPIGSNPPWVVADERN